MRLLEKIRIVLFCSILGVVPVLSPAQTTDYFDIHLQLHKNGSATLVERISAYTPEGTEFYIPINNLAGMAIRDLKVWEDDVEFIPVETWDVRGTILQKAGRCGINPTYEGVELCWGLGSHGSHLWTVQYEIEGLVQSYTDYDAFNFQFINPGMAAPPKRVTLVVEGDTGCGEWTDDTVREWAFGCSGNVDLMGGRVQLISTDALSSREYVNLMLRFNKGIFEPTVSHDRSFSNLQDAAFKNSSYESEGDDIIGIIIGLSIILSFIIFITWIIVEVIRGNVYKKSLFGVHKIKGWYRQAPLDGNLAAAYHIYKNSSRFGVVAFKDDDLIGAYFLKWILEGNVKILQADSRWGKNVKLEFVPEKPAFTSPAESRLYDMALKAAGDHVLENAEFKRWAMKNSGKLLSWPEQVDDEGFAYFGTDAIKVGSLKPEAQMKARNLVEFKNFLEDFTLVSKREAIEVKLWKDYLIYAQFFGIADKVAKEFSKLFPGEFAQFTQQLGCSPSEMLWRINWVNSMSGRAYGSAAAKASGASGTGGRISSFGGGGFSGGGFGGGAR